MSFLQACESGRTAPSKRTAAQGARHGFPHEHYIFDKWITYRTAIPYAVALCGGITHAVSAIS